MRSSRASDPDSPASEAPSAEADAAEPSPEELSARLEETSAQLAAAEDRYLRARADLDNYRKRTERDVERRVLEQRDELVRAWLEAIDSVERALALHAAEPGLAEGLRVFLEQMQAILARQGVTRIGEVGERFDPELHEAIAVVPSADRPAGTIAEVARSGYSAGDRVLRPAQVAVIRPSDDSG
jgi:molecular chaperone GrpE